jgi:hypothetical protein
MDIKFINFFVMLSFLFLSACNQMPTKNDSKPSSQGTSFKDSRGTGNPDRITSGLFPTTAPKTPFTMEWKTRTGTAINGTLHVIVAADTNDSSIGPSAKTDLDNMHKLVWDISQHAGLALIGGAIAGDDFTSSNVSAAINGLTVGPNDVVFFFYSGHGVNLRDSRWPAMDFQDKKDKPNLTEVRDKLKQKGPRLLIVMADTCNHIIGGQGGSQFSRATEKPENYKELFVNYSGTIIASGSKPGEYSWGNKARGGLYVDAFLKSLSQELASSGRPSWEALMKRANSPLMANNGKRQNPQSKVEVYYTETIDCNITPQLPECETGPPSGGDGYTCVSDYYQKGNLECCTLNSGRELCFE